MILGYQRTLQVPDLWKMDQSRQSGFLSDKLDASWANRVQVANEWNAKLDSGEISPGARRRVWWYILCLYPTKVNGRSVSVSERLEGIEKEWREKSGRKHASIAGALNDTFGWHFWAGGLFKVVGDTSQMMSPLVVRVRLLSSLPLSLSFLITYSLRTFQAIINYTEKGKEENDRNIGRGVAMAIGLFLLTVTASICQHQVTLYHLHPEQNSSKRIHPTNNSSSGDQCQQVS